MPSEKPVAISLTSDTFLDVPSFGEHLGGSNDLRAARHCADLPKGHSSISPATGASRQGPTAHRMMPVNIIIHPRVVEM